VSFESSFEGVQDARIADGSRYIVPGSQCRDYKRSVGGSQKMHEAGIVWWWCQSAVPSAVGVYAAHIRGKSVFQCGWL